jgi:hypothetical protein
MDDDHIITGFAAESPLRMHVSAPGAYQHFVEGGLLFDVSPNAELLEEFYRRNKAEFYGDQIVRGIRGPFPYQMRFERQLYTTYHKHAARERFTRDLQDVEQELSGS